MRHAIDINNPRQPLLQAASFIVSIEFIRLMSPTQRTLMADRNTQTAHAPSNDLIRDIIIFDAKADGHRSGNVDQSALTTTAVITVSRFAGAECHR
jgi:hypothetical protein